MVSDLAAKQPQNGPKWPPTVSKMGLKTAETGGFQKKDDPRPFEVLLWGCFDPVLYCFDSSSHQHLHNQLKKGTIEKTHPWRNHAEMGQLR